MNSLLVTIDPFRILNIYWEAASLGWTVRRERGVV